MPGDAIIIDKPKHAGGRPRKFTDPDILAADIDAYFDKCDNTIITMTSKKHGVIDIADPYTVEDLCRYLNTDRNTLDKYENKEEFGYIITRAKQKIVGAYIKGGIIGLYEPRLVQLIVTNMGDYSMKTEISCTVNQIQQINNTDIQSLLAIKEQLQLQLDAIEVDSIDVIDTDINDQ